MSNPYGEEPYVTAWQLGYDYGSQNPTDTSPQPPDFSTWGYDESVTGYCAQVWSEGALAGREATGASVDPGGGAPGGDDGGGAGGGGAGAGDEVISLPEDVATELANLREYYPESFAILDAGNAKTYLRDYVGVEYIPSEDDDDDLPVA